MKLLIELREFLRSLTMKALRNLAGTCLLLWITYLTIRAVLVSRHWSTLIVAMAALTYASYVAGRAVNGKLPWKKGGVH